MFRILKGIETINRVRIMNSIGFMNSIGIMNSVGKFGCVELVIVVWIVGEQLLYCLTVRMMLCCR